MCSARVSDRQVGAEDRRADAADRQADAADPQADTEARREGAAALLAEAEKILRLRLMY